MPIQLMPYASLLSLLLIARAALNLTVKELIANLSYAIYCLCLNRRERCQHQQLGASDPASALRSWLFVQAPSLGPKETSKELARPRKAVHSKGVLFHQLTISSYSSIRNHPPFLVASIGAHLEAFNLTLAVIDEEGSSTFSANMENVSLDCYNSIALSIILDLLNPRRIKKPIFKYGGPSSPVVIVCIADYHQPFISQRSLTSRNLVGVRCRPRCAVRINPIAVWYSKHLPWQTVTGLTNFVPSIRPYRNKCSAEKLLGRYFFN